MKSPSHYHTIAVMVTSFAFLEGCGIQARYDAKEMQERVVVSQNQCKQEIASPSLNPIREKVELYRAPGNHPPSFAYTSNDTFPSDADRPVIAQWAQIRDECTARTEAILAVPRSATAAQRNYLEQLFAVVNGRDSRIGQLVLALYQQKLTYGEFAQKRYEITRDAQLTILAIQQAQIDRDLQRQALAQQQFANSLAAWGTYMQAVNARQPQTVYLNGTIQVVH